MLRILGGLTGIGLSVLLGSFSPYIRLLFVERQAFLEYQDGFEMRQCCQAYGPAGSCFCRFGLV